jgi:Glycosyl transferase family 11
MLVIQEKQGMQLANRLFLFSHFIANAIEHKYVLINPTFDEYCQYFPAVRNNDFTKHLIYSRFSINFPYVLFEFTANFLSKMFPLSQWHEFIQSPVVDEIDLNDSKFIEKAKHKVVFAKGWLFRDQENFSKHSDLIRSFFVPDSKVVDKIDKLIADCRNKSEVVVGVHLRKGDYKIWNEGKYYFSNDVYADKMEQIRRYFNSLGKEVLFLMCSDELIQEQYFENKYNVKLGIGSLIEDLYSLAKCDYLIGPPSTYSMWASFYGKVPLSHILDQSQLIKIGNFSIVE